MSLNPVSYLQAWEQNLAAAHHRYRGLHAENESDSQDEVFQDLPESSSSSASFLSRFSHDSLGHRLNFYPYAGAGVTDGSRNTSPIRGFSFPYVQTVTGQDGVPESKTIAAYEVSRSKRIGKLLKSMQIRCLLSLLAQICVSVISCFLTSGIIYGFAALKPVLIKEGVYSTECSPDELQGRILCYGQELRYVTLLLLFQY